MRSVSNSATGYTRGREYLFAGEGGRVGERTDYLSQRAEF